MICPRCGGTAFVQKDCGADSYDDNITYTSDICVGCGLWHDGWTDKWLVDVEQWNETEGAEVYQEEFAFIDEIFASDPATLAALIQIVEEDR